MARNLTKKRREKIKQYLIKNGYSTIADVAWRMGVGETTIRTIIKELGSKVEQKTLEDDRKIQKERQEKVNSNKLYKDALKRLDDLEKELSTYRSCDGIIDSASPMKISAPKLSTNSEAVPILIASDWHIDEVIEGGSIGHLNHFNLDVARVRVHRFFSYAGKLVEILKKDSDIDTLIVAALGDFMSSWIHDELIESNSLTPPEAILELFEMWVGGLDFLLDTGLVKKIRFVGAVGNHGRITQKIQFKGRHKKSYEWILYGLLFKHYKARNEKRITFQLPNGYFNWVNLFGKDIRFHHGDNLRYSGGVGGVHIPVRRAIAQWDKAMQADLDVFGHWHTLEWSSKYVINNSLIGYSAYAENLKADFMKAGQAMFLMHSKYGKTAQFPIVLQD